jgi:hypothetical protein
LFKKLAIKIGTGFLTALLTLMFFAGVRYAMAQETPVTDCSPFNTQVSCEYFAECQWDGTTCTLKDTEVTEPATTASETAEEPVKNQVMNIDQAVSELAEWEPSNLQTFGTKFLIRGKEALTWTLNIKDAGFHNEAIQSSYSKVLTIVNSIFILGLLAIAGMWMFSIFIPRRYLKQVVFVFAAAVIFVNFALPLNRLLIDGTNILQRTLLTQDGEKITITNIVETPSYADANGYKTTTGETEKQIDITFKQTPGGDVEIGRVESPSKQVSGDMGGSAITLDIPESNENKIVMNSDQSLSIKEKAKFSPADEQTVFSFILIMATGLAYFILAMIFVLRIVILWALLILSPALLLLAIFKSTRGWFWNWLGIYGRWLLIGPLAALGISVIVNIWQTVGIPIINDTTSVESFGTGLSNISFYLPGSTTPNTLSNTSEMMQYLIFLMMLYLPIFFAFALTRQKMLQGVTAIVTERFKNQRKTTPIETAGGANGVKTESKEGSMGMMGAIKDIFSSKIAKVTETALPSKLRETESATYRPIPGAASFLPEQLALTGTHEMLGLIGANDESRHSRDTAVEKLAFPNSIQDTEERKNVSAVRSEIGERAERGDIESIVLMNEIMEKQSGVQTPVESAPGAPIAIPIKESATATAEAFVETKVEVTTPVQEKEPEKKGEKIQPQNTKLETQNPKTEIEDPEDEQTSDKKEEKEDEMKQDEEYNIQ